MECEAAVARRVDIAVQQVAVWQAAAQATTRLQTAQEQKAAKAAQQPQKVSILLLWDGSASNPNTLVLVAFCVINKHDGS